MLSYKDSKGKSPAATPSAQSSVQKNALPAASAAAAAGAAANVSVVSDQKENHRGKDRGGKARGGYERGRGGRGRNRGNDRPDGNGAAAAAAAFVESDPVENLVERDKGSGSRGRNRNKQGRGGNGGRGGRGRGNGGRGGRGGNVRQISAATAAAAAPAESEPAENIVERDNGNGRRGRNRNRRGRGNGRGRGGRALHDPRARSTSPSGNRPNVWYRDQAMESTATSRKTGLKYVGYSGPAGGMVPSHREGNGPDKNRERRLARIAPHLKDVKNLEDRLPQNCAEPAAASIALSHGEALENLDFIAVDSRGLVTPPCKNCSQWVPKPPDER